MTKSGGRVARGRVKAGRGSVAGAGGWGGVKKPIKILTAGFKRSK